jgi:hypothetical protein
MLCWFEKEMKERKEEVEVDEEETVYLQKENEN